jgi:hypothetical protein
MFSGKDAFVECVVTSCCVCGLLGAGATLYVVHRRTLIGRLAPIICKASD